MPGIVGHRSGIVSSSSTVLFVHKVYGVKSTTFCHWLSRLKKQLSCVLQFVSSFDMYPDNFGKDFILYEL